MFRYQFLILYVTEVDRAYVCLSSQSKNYEQTGTQAESRSDWTALSHIAQLRLIEQIKK